MNDKKDLLSVGEMAKLTGVSIRALHYYERKNILKPAYIDPNSGYRYYSYNQSNFIALIMNCVDFDIPLKEIASVIESDDMAALKIFVEVSIETLEKKSKLLKLAIGGLGKVLQKIELGKQYKIGEIYQREFEEKTYYAKLYGQTIKERYPISVVLEMAHELFGKRVNHVVDVDNLDDIIPVADAGHICRYSQDGIDYYGFVETPPNFVHENCITIPAGNYFFRHDVSSQIENAPEIFKEQLKGRDAYMMIEVEEMFLSKAKASQTIYELRFVGLHQV